MATISRNIWIGSSLAGLLLLGPSVGCGDEVTSYGAGGAGGSGTGGSAGGGTGGSTSGTGGGSGTTLDEVCEELAPLICASRQSCCEAAEMGYDAAGCEAQEIEQCEANVAEVEAGTMTFDPTAIDPCLAAYEPYLDLCFVGAAEKLAMIEVRQLCRSIFVGDLPLGDPCERHAQCAPAPAAEDMSYCDGDTGQCAVTDVLAAAEACFVGGGPQPLCASGLYCDAELGGGQPPFEGNCAPATPLGDPCAAGSQPPSFECGTGYLCDPSSGTCSLAKEPGEPCMRPFECRSLVCTQDQVCGRLDVLVDEEACLGSP